jgi:hypothetical protein
MTQDNQNIRIDNVLWWIFKDTAGNRVPQPLCPIHHLRMEPIRTYNMGKYDSLEESASLKCEDCEKSHSLPRTYKKERAYVINRIDAKIFKGMKVLNLDDEAIPLSEEKISSNDNKYFVTGLLTKSKIGLRLVVYAGEKGKKEKTQIFVEPEIKRLAFDQKDLHPTDVFTKLEATFKDGSTNSINKK